MSRGRRGGVLSLELDLKPYVRTREWKGAHIVLAFFRPTSSTQRDHHKESPCSISLENSTP